MTTNTFGYTPTRNNWFFSDGASDNQAWDTPVTINDVGRITDINAYFAGDTAGCTGGPLLADGITGTILQYTSHAVSQGTQSATGGFVVTTSNLDITFTSGTSYIVGGFRNSTQSWIVPFADNVGAYGFLKTVAGTTPGVTSGGSSWVSQTGFNGGITAYATYLIGATYVRRSNAWTKVHWPVRRSSAWPNTSAEPEVKVRRGNSWTAVDIVARELDSKKEQEVIVVQNGNWERGIFRWLLDEPRTFGRLVVA